MTKEETMRLLERFFFECLRYWERALKVDSDTSNEAYINAINDIPSHNPYSPTGTELNQEWVAEFRNYRLMDCYGKEWKRYAET